MNKNNNTIKYRAKKNHKKMLTNLKNIKKKIEFMEFKRHYVLNKNNEWVKRSFGGQHEPKPGSNRRGAKLKHYQH